MVRDPRDTDREFDRGWDDRSDYERGRRPFERSTDRAADYGQRDLRRPTFARSDLDEGGYPPSDFGRQRDFEQHDYQRGGYTPRDYGMADDETEEAFRQRRSRADVRQRWEGPFKGVGPRNYRRSDERIREDASDRLSMHSHVDARNVEVEVIDAVVVLRGSVPDREMKRFAEDAVEGVPGVRDIRNELRIDDRSDVRGAAAPMGARDTRAGNTAMTTARRTVLGIFTDADRAEDAVNELREAGFDRSDISVVARGEREARDAAGSSGAGRKGMGAGALLGGIAGGALGWLIGAGSLAIPGVGPVIAVGALGTALAGAAAGVVAGGLIGLLAGIGVPEEQAKTYETAIEKGGILVTCGCESDREVARAREILQRHAATEVRDYDSREAQQRLRREHPADRDQVEPQRAEVR